MPSDPTETTLCDAQFVGNHRHSLRCLGAGDIPSLLVVGVFLTPKPTRQRFRRIQGRRGSEGELGLLRQSSGLCVSRRERLAGFDAVLPLASPPPRAPAKGDQHLDGLEELGPSAASPCPSADWASVLAEVRIEKPPLVIVGVRFQVSRIPGTLAVQSAPAVMLVGGCPVRRLPSHGSSSQMLSWSATTQ